jgi:hypothetical protein
MGIVHTSDLKGCGGVCTCDIYVTRNQGTSCILGRTCILGLEVLAVSQDQHVPWDQCVSWDEDVSYN